MRIAIAAITFAVTMGGLFLFESYKASPQDHNYAKIVSELQQSSTPSPSFTVQPKKTPNKTSQPTKKSASIITPSPSPTVSGSPAPSPSTTPIPTPKTHTYYTSSSTSAKYYYCDTDSGWKSLSKANLKQFSSPEELLKSYPTRTLHELCKD